MKKTICLTKPINKKKLVAILAIGLVSIIGFYIQPTIQTVFKLANNNQNRLLPIYCVERNDKKISISFDAAWGADDTDPV